MKWFSEKILLFGMAIVALAIGILISLSWNESENLKKTNQDVLHVKDIMFQTGKIISLILDNETNVRAFALIGDEKFSDQVKATDTSVDNEFKVLKILAGNNPLEKNNLDSLAKYIDKKTEFSYNIIAYRRTGGQQAALKYILTGDGIAYTAKIRKIINQMQTVESNLLVQHNMQYSKVETIKDRYYYLVIFFVFALVIVLLFALSRQFSAQKRIKKELETEVKVKTEQLNHVFERITGGFMAFDTHWNFTYLNKRAGEILNRDPEKMIGKNVWTEFPKHLGLDFYQAAHKALETQQHIYLENKSLLSDHWLMNHIYPAADGVSVFIDDITERKNIENALKESEEKFHNFFENTPVGIIIRGIDGATIDFNNTLCNLLGYPRKELIQKPWTEVSHPDDIQLTSYWMQKLKDGTCDSARFEKRFFHRNGNIIWVDLSMFIYLNSEGKPLYIITSILDITDRKKAESELKASEEKYRTLVLEASDGIILQDIDGKLIDANESASAITGYSIEELRKMSVSDLITKEELEKIPYRLEEIKKGNRVHIERVIKRKDNTLIDVSTNARLLNNGIVMAIMRDITQRKLSEKALKESEEKFSKVFHNSPEIIFLLSLETLKIVDVNESVFKIAGYKREELIGKTAAEFSLWANVEDRNKNLELLKTVGSVQNFEARLKKRTGEIFPALVSSEVIQLGESKYFISIINDITKRKKAEDELKQSREDYKNLFDKHRAVKLLIDPETGNIFDANAAAAEYYGWTREELRKMKVQDINGASSAEVQQKLREAEALENFHFEFKHKKADGQIGDVEIYGSVTTISGRKYLHSIIFDITDKKKSEEALRQSEKNLKRGELTAKFGYWEIKSDEESVYLSEGAQKIFGIDKAKLSYAEMKSFRLPEYHVPMDEAFRAIVEENKPYNIEYKLKRPSDGAIVDIHSIAEYDPKTRTLFGVVQDITERKRAEEQYKTILETTIDGFYLIDLEGNILDTNDSYCSMIGYSRDELLKMSIKDVEAIDTEEEIKKNIQHIMNTGPVYFETQHKRKDGRIIDIEASCGFLEEDKTRLFVFMRDITERKKHEEKIRQLSEAVEQSPATIVITDVNGNIQYANPMFTATTGYNIAEAIGQNPHILKSGFTSDEEYKKLWETISSGKKWSGEFYNRKKNGEFYWESATISPIVDEHGKTTNYLAVKSDITERKKAEEALQDANTYNRRLIEASIDPLVTIGQDGKITDVNTSTELATGYKREELIGTDFSEYFTEPGKAKAGYQQVFTKGKVFDYPLEIRNRNGHITPVLYNATIYEDNKGRIAGVFAAARDVTENKRLEKEREQYFNFFNISPDLMVIADPNGCFKKINPAGLSLLGFSEAELLSKPFIDFVHPDDRQQTLDEMANQIKTGSSMNFENRYLCKDDESRILSWRANYVANEGTTFATARDITEAKLAENKIQNANRYNRSLIEASIDPLVTIGQDGKITDVNSSTEQVTGYKREELIGTDFSDYFTEPEKAKAGYQEVFTKGMVYDYPLEIKNRGGKITPVLYNATIYKDSKGNVAGVFAAARNITERKKAEEALKKSEEKFRHLISELNTGVLLHGPGGEVLMSNQRALDLIALSEDQVLGKVPFDPDWNVIHEDGSVYQDEEHAVPQAIKTKKTIRHVMGFYNPRKKERLWVLVTAVPEIENDGTVRQLICTFTDITERKKSEEEIRASENRFRSLFEQAADGIFISDSNGKYVDVNKSGCLLMGYTKDEILKLSADDFVFDDEKEKEPPRIKELVEGKTVRYERRLKRKDGTGMIAEVSGKKIADGRNIVFIRDITERKKAEEKVKASEMRYRRLFESAKDGILILNADSGEIIDVNPFLVEMLGYSYSQFIGKQLWEIGLFKDIFANKEAFLKLQDDRYIRYENLPLKTKDGRPAWVEFVSNVYNVNGTKVIQCNIRNITDRIQAEEVIKASEARYRSLIEQASDAIFVSDETGKYVDVNTSTCKMLGYTREEFLKFTIMDLVFKEDLEKNPVHFHDMRAGKMVHYERRLKRKDGTAVEVEISGQKISDGRNLIFARDITERKKAEQELRESEEKFSTAFYATPNLMAITRISDSTIIEVNDGYSKLLGYSRTESIGKTTNELSIWANEADRITFVNTLKEFGQIDNFETKLRCKDGTLVTVIDSARTIKLRDEKCILSIVNDITERKKAEEALMESEMKYRGLVENSPDAIVIYIKGEIVFANRATVNLMGASGNEELIGKSVIQFVHPDYQKVVIERMKKVAKEGTAVPLLDEKFIRFDGSEVDVEVQSMPILYQGKNAVQMIVHDITERKQALDALNRSEKRFKTLFEKASDGILIMSGTGKIINVNESFAKMHGYEVSEMLQMNLRKLDTPEMAKILPEMIGRVLAGETIHIDVDHYHKDGHIISFAVSSSLIQVGNESYIQAFHTDITERKRVAEEFQTTIKTTSDGFWIIDMTTRKFLDVNESYCKLIGYSKDELLNMTIPDIEANESEQEVKDHSQKIKKKGTDTFVTRHKTKSGELIDVEVSVTYSGNIGGRAYVFVRDITQRLKSEQEIKNTAMQLRRLTNHLQTIREEERVRIGREIHDELGQQLTAIKMDAAWIDHKTPEKETAIKNKLKNIITLLDISNLSVRKILSELKPVIFDDRDLPEAMEWQNRQFTERTGTPVEFNVLHIDLDLPESISTCIFRVYQESLTNIAKYAHANKVVSSLSFEEDNIYLTVEDDGMGFVPESLIHKKTFGLLGMKERVLSLNGKFKVISALGKGTKIKVSIPLEEKETNEKLF